MQCMEVHLQFMAFLLQEGALYLPNKRAGEIWETLIANPNSCPEDRTVSGVDSHTASVYHSLAVASCRNRATLIMLIRG